MEKNLRDLSEFSKIYLCKGNKMSKEKIEFEIGSGNVYKDLGFPNPEDMQRICKRKHVLFSKFRTL
jgi:hypothetical protein